MTFGSFSGRIISMLNEYNKNRRIFPIPYVPKSTSAIGLPPAEVKGTTGGKGPGQDGWESVNGVVEGPVQAIDAMENEGGSQQGRWPDGGINKPTRVRDALSRDLALAALGSSNVIYPREDDQPAKADKKIHNFCLNEDFENTSIDKPEDDENDWGGIEDIAEALHALDQEALDKIDRDEIGTESGVKYGPGNYPEEVRDDEYYTQKRAETQAFYDSIFEADKEPFEWIIPDLVAVGPHPIFGSQKTDLSFLAKAGIKAIVSVFDKPLDKKYRTGFQYLFIPTTEGFASDLEAVCRFIDAQDGRPVFIHGLKTSRAATALAAYFAYKGWLTPVEAIEYVRHRYDKTAITTAQEDAILLLAHKL